MKQRIDERLYKSWKIAIIIAIIFGVYFIRSYIAVIIVSIIMAFLFNPIHQRFMRRYKRPGISASLTFVVSGVVILIPLLLILLLTVHEIKDLLNSLPVNPDSSLTAASQDLLNAVNNILAKIPGAHQLSTQDITNFINKTISALATNALNLIKSSFGGISRAITTLIIYIYLFVNILMHQDKLLEILKSLNPLGDDMSNTYLQKMSDMTIAMGRGQFIIAFLQGTESAIVLYLIGFHSLFIFFEIFLTFLSLIPLGAGIITIPLGIILILTGHYWQGTVVLLNHLLIVTNIDNVVRPKLVPKTASLNSALTILSVFAGVAMFGFFGIIIGPVIMIVIVTTLTTYLDTIVPNAK